MSMRQDATTDPDFEPLVVAVRAYAVPQSNTEPETASRASRQKKPKKRRDPHRVLMIDTETTVDASQRLNFGSWRYYVDRPDGLAGAVCVEEGLLFADDLPDRDPDGFEVLRRYVESHRADVFPGRSAWLRLLSRTEFVRQILYQYAYKNRATVVGFNLPFDLARLALSASASRRRFAGGNSLRLFEEERYKPRIAYKAIDSRRTLIGFTSPDGGDKQFRGHFLDLRTLCFSLTDRAFTLESACSAFDVPYTKRSVTHGSISEEYVTYCREDVAATANLFRAATAEFRRHPINLQVTKAYSPASIGKSYLSAMGVPPILDRQPDFPAEVLGRGMAAFFGGRAECRIRKVPVPVVYVDFLSMYPTVNVLMETWELVTAGRVAVEDSTEQVRRLLCAPNLLARCFRRGFWPQLRCLVDIEPDGDILPVRAAYDPGAVDYGIGVNPYRLGGAAWYTLADVVAAVLLGRRVPVVRRAVTLRAVGRRKGLRPVSIRGMVEVDPREGDFFRRVIELRKQVDVDPSYTAAERRRLSLFLKVLANAASYGILVEFVRQEQTDPVPVVVHADGDDPFSTSTLTPENPGAYCFPPVAAIITGAARLMLALLERSVTDLGGHYLFCDTDSMGIVATRAGEAHSRIDALTFEEVDEIVGRFEVLNPYDRSVVPGSILKIEDENFDDQRRRRQLWGWGISSKRYALYVLDGNGEPDLVKVSEHGLGHLLNPRDPDDSSTTWMAEAWEFLLRRSLGLETEIPPWLDRPALTRVTASGPFVLRWFAGYNRERQYEEQIKPGNFLLLAHPDPLDPSGALPIAPYEGDASRWGRLPWVDRRTGNPISVTVEPFDGNDRPGTVRVRTYRDVLVDYLGHPEAKSLAPDGTGGGSGTTGILRRRPVEGIPPVVRIGKEGNRLDDRLSGLVSGPEEYRTEYVDVQDDVWSTLVVPVLATIPRKTAATYAGLHRRSVERLLARRSRPHRSHEPLLTELAVHYAKESLKLRGNSVPGDDRAALYSYIHRSK